ncbi:hypothetical protein JOD55_000206 [Arcanobacterium pluranimalium]|nr:hypothetical protein [Arcanobacterium pluranimalium]
MYAQNKDGSLPFKKYASPLHDVNCRVVIDSTALNIAPLRGS